MRTGDSLRLWINGADTAGLALTPNANIAVNTATWFRQPNFGPDQDTVTRAAYDDTAIWKRALTAAEVAQIYNGGTGATIASLTAVPEPSTYGLTVAGAFVASAVFRRRRRAA